MARKKTGEWMVVNVVINGINLGKTFRNQFVQSAQRSGGDIDQVIDGWLSDQSKKLSYGAPLLKARL